VYVFIAWFTFTQLLGVLIMAEKQVWNICAEKRISSIPTGSIFTKYLIKKTFLVCGQDVL